jgi:transmembrane sensor
MPRDARTKLNTQIYDQAAEWLVEFRAGDVDPTARQRFNAWLRTSPEHVRAYLEIAAIWNEGPELDPARGYRAEDIAALTSTNSEVLPLDAAISVVPPAQIPVVRPRWWLATAAALLIAVAGLGSWVYTQRNTFSTRIGEQRSIALEDGSTVELNSRSRLRVRYADSRRVVHLLEGQALFRVAKDASRPFVVRAGDTQVRVIGTEFDVYRKKTGTVVTVLEGRVAVSGSAHTINDQQLAAGEQLILASPMPAQPHPVPANTAAVTAWTQRQLIFETTPLAEVADEFNRYNTRQLVVTDATLEGLEISGVFSSTDPSSLVNFLRARPGIEVSETEQTIHITRTR